MDIHQVITLGIGTPADIPHFILVGLSPTGAVAIVDADPQVVTIRAAGRRVTLRPIGRVVTIRAAGRVVDAGEKA